MENNNIIITSDGQGKGFASPLHALVDGIRDYNNPAMPIHLQMLQGYEPAMQAALLDAYTGAPPTAFSSVAGEQHLVLGMILHESGSYVSLKDGREHPEGYFTALVLTDTIKNGRRLVIGSSGKYLLTQVFTRVNTDGWWLFEQPQTYLFSTHQKIHRFALIGANYPLFIPSKNVPS